MNNVCALGKIMTLSNSTLQIIKYIPKYKQNFIDFNTAWIIDNFDFLRKRIKKPFDTIDEELKKGATIYFAAENDIALATCMAKPMDDSTWEICKLGSNKNAEHKGNGSAVFGAAVQ